MSRLAATRPLFQSNTDARAGPISAIPFHGLFASVPYGIVPLKSPQCSPSSNSKDNSGSGEPGDGKPHHLRPAGTGGRGGAGSGSSPGSGSGSRRDDGCEPGAGQGCSRSDAAITVPVVAVGLAPKGLCGAGRQGGGAGARNNGCNVMVVLIVVIRMLGSRGWLGAGGRHAWPFTVPGGLVSSRC